MTSRSIPAIDPGGAAARLGAAGDGIVFALAATGIDGRHPHFARHANLELSPPLYHYDLMLIQPDTFRVDQDLSLDEALAANLAKLDDDTFSDEALIDPHGFGTHLAGIIAGYADGNDASVAWDFAGAVDVRRGSEMQAA